MKKYHIQYQARIISFVKSGLKAWMEKNRFDLKKPGIRNYTRYKLRFELVHIREILKLSDSEILKLYLSSKGSLGYPSKKHYTPSSKLSNIRMMVYLQINSAIDARAYQNVWTSPENQPATTVKPGEFIFVGAMSSSRTRLGVNNEEVPQTIPSTSSSEHPA